MARITIRLDGYHFQIDSTNPRILAEWMMEIFGRQKEYHPSSYIQVNIEPSYIPDPASPDGYKSDWWTNVHYWQEYRARTPQELIEEVQKHLRELNEHFA